MSPLQTERVIAALMLVIARALHFSVANYTCVQLDAAWYRGLVAAWYCMLLPLLVAFLACYCR
ncbi:protein of unknown function [Pararobbsia alpina]